MSSNDEYVEVYLNLFLDLLKFSLFFRIDECREEDVQTSTSKKLVEMLGYRIGAKIGFGSYSTVRVRAFISKSIFKH